MTVEKKMNHGEPLKRFKKPPTSKEGGTCRPKTKSKETLKNMGPKITRAKKGN